MIYRATPLTALWMKVKRTECIDNRFIAAGTILLVIVALAAIARLMGWPGLDL